MARIENTDHTLVHGKLNKKADKTFRTRNGQQFAYSSNKKPGTASPAQKAHRSLFGKVNSIVNVIMADPAQTAEWEKRRLAFNKHAALTQQTQSFKTTRQFVHHSIKAQLLEQQATKRRTKPIKRALPKGLTFHCKHFSELTNTELYEILKARFSVFYMEQHCYYQDMDNIDYSAFHLTIRRQGQVIAYARLFQGSEPGIWHLGRMLSIERAKGYGTFIMKQAATEAKKHGASTIEIHAQTQAEPFYSKLGFHTFSGIFMEAEIPHVLMRQDL